MNRSIIFSFIFLFIYLIEFSKATSWETLPNMEEICDNALDDDNDGLVDINDPDCMCELIQPTSLIPNPSFEDLNCCPSDRSQLNCADVWIQASAPTTDLINTCGWPGWEEFPPPLPFPDGEGILGFRDGRVRRTGERETNWKEYAGACLLEPMLADSVYRFEFDVGFVNNLQSPPINITFFGSTDCNNLPFGQFDQDFGCPTNGPGWINLGATFLSGGSGTGWEKGIIEVTPQETIQAIVIGPDCPGVQSEVSIYYFFDNLLLSNFESFELRISEMGHPCSDSFTLRIGDRSEFAYQWYKDGIALLGETEAALKNNYGTGAYQVRIDDGEVCRVSGTFTHSVPVFSETINQTICKEDTYSFGDRLLTESGTYVDTFKTAENCLNVVTLNLNVLGLLADTVQANIFEGESFALDRFQFKSLGEHIVTLPSTIGCDSLVLVQLDFFNVYFPNVFSPNFDGINDVFRVQSEAGLVDNVELSIFDRWGNLIFQGAEWDGNYKGDSMDAGVFIYLVELLMNDGKKRRFSGEVTLLK